ncbi:MAG TPA: S26 family signal peptidase [Planctomycetaceae bacterium]|jgi:signal peptidase I/rubredoxin|nr:S26 family signal peptidase [Planctomycetaceae bacterium]
MSPLPPSDTVMHPEEATRPAVAPPVQPADQPPAAQGRKKQRGSLRALIDAGICLYVAVILFRTFEIEGYIISTGSMAPHLLGFHKRVVCPACGYQFTHGIPVDETGTAADTTDDVAHEGPGQVRCPNCGENRIDIRSTPPNHGDQLLVQKNVFEFRPPRRWEVVVLKSPSRPTPFVKRIVGLPSESVQVKDGDIYVDGEICRKDLAQQRTARILVNDNDYLPDDPPEGKSCWSIEDSKSGWSTKGSGFVFAPSSGQSKSAAKESTAWIAFRRVVRHGGRHQTAVQISDSKPIVHTLGTAFPQVRYNQAARKLESMGAVDRAVRDRLMAINSVAATRTAIEELFEQSHVAAITDDYGYNRANAGLIPLAVRDTFLECEVALGSGSGVVTFEISDGRLTFEVIFDRGKNEARLELVGQREPLRSAALTAEEFARPFQFELSTFDRQVIAAVNGSPLFPAWECPTDRAEPSRVPVRIGAQGGAVEVSRLRIYRDIYYTRGQGRNGVDQPIQLGADEFFVLGDNSPVSNDGRSWPQGAIKRSQLIGKPFVVHLPSRPGRISFGGFTRYIRVPDFSRIRYIR